MTPILKKKNYLKGDFIKVNKMDHPVVFISCQFRIILNLSRYKHDSFNNFVKLLRPKSNTKNK